MAALHAPSPSFLATFLPVARAQLFPHLQQPVRRIPLLQRLRASASLLPAALVPIPGLLGDLWDGLLNAVPKKKTSHMKKRHRQMASGKHLRDVTALNKCSACGRTKRAHVLCPYCVQSIRRWISTGFRTTKELEEEDTERLVRINEERRLRGAKPLDLPKPKINGEGERKADTP
ncbi:uncharacterized protein LTR77_010413 [Saxophila tyrrhenica]|uniref:Large ribosomal subunit protein bL32m n=1 Tax=Saxophila tyrrhenica TaxID=1690608 RepID=A0AAV9NX27_9PEZI|nr:hypothetical protein LTR77_010413 [Saxophila tyrrhenica]